MAEKNFVIFGQGHTGSNLLRSLLNSHPNIFIDGELFGPQRLKNFTWLKKMEIKTRPIKHINFRREIANADIYGFKLFVWQHLFSKEIIKTLHRKDWKIIHLQRRNTLKQVFSGLISQENKLYVREEKTPVSTEIFQLKPANVFSELKFRNKNNIFAKRALKNIPCLEIFFEDHLQKENLWQNTSNQIFDLLGTESYPVSTKMLITDPRPDWERIENFEEIIRFLNEAGFSNIVKDYYKYL